MNVNKEQIKALRKKLKISQDKFAERIGVTGMTIRRWESGKSTPSPMAQKLIQELAQEAK